MKQNYLVLVGVPASLAAAPSAHSQLISVTATVKAQTQVFNFSSLDAALTQFSGTNLATSFPGFRDGNAVAADIVFNGGPL